MSEFFPIPSQTSTTDGKSPRATRTSNMNPNCPCVVKDDAGNCIDCGVAPPNIPTVEDMGNVVAVSKLACNTLIEVTRCIIENSDPKDKITPLLRMLGGQMIRIPHEDIFNRVMQRSFKEAQTLGYRGTLARWAAIVKDSRQLLGMQRLPEL